VWTRPQRSRRFSVNLFVLRHRHPIDSRTGLPLLSSNARRRASSSKWCSRAGNRVWAACLAAAFTRSRFGSKATRFCVRTLASRAGSPRGGPFPPCVSLPDDFTGTMNQSDSRPQLGQRLWQCLAAVLPLETNPADLVGPLMFRSLPSMRDPAIDPDGLHRLAYRRCSCCLRTQGAHSGSANFRLSRLIPVPTWLLFTLGTPRSRDARKTRSDGTCTRRHSSAWHDVLPSDGVAW
jgi:hypothetical protein